MGLLSMNRPRRRLEREHEYRWMCVHNTRFKSLTHALCPESNELRLW